MSSKRDLAVKAVRGCTLEIILRAAALCDGHTILDTQAFTQAELPQPVVSYMTRVYRSDGSPKGTLFTAGQPVEELTGVYGLDLLRFLAAALGVDYRSALGRGFEARNIQEALRAHCRRNAEKAG